MTICCPIEAEEVNVVKIPETGRVKSGDDSRTNHYKHAMRGKSITSYKNIILWLYFNEALNPKICMINFKLSVHCNSGLSD